MSVVSEQFVSKSLLQLKGNFISDKEGTGNYQRAACQMLTMRNFPPDKPGALSSQWWFREAFAGQCSLKKPVGCPPSSLQPGKPNTSTAVSSSYSGSTEQNGGISSRGIPRAPY